MKYIDAVSLYLLYCAMKSRQNNSAFFVEACISEIIEFAVMPILGPHSWIFYSWFYIPSAEKIINNAFPLSNSTRILPLVLTSNL